MVNHNKFLWFECWISLVYFFCGLEMKTKFSERIKLNQGLTVPPQIKAEWMVMSTDFHPKESLFGSELEKKKKNFNLFFSFEFGIFFC